MQANLLRSTVFFAGLLLCLSIAGPGWSGNRGHEPSRNRASFQIEAVREIPNDWATARLSVVSEGKDAAAVSASVNTTMAAALKRAKRVKQVEVRSGSYVTHPIYDDGRVVRWRASQDLVLESSDVDRLSELIGELQSKSILLSGIQFGVRRETRAALEEELISEALTRFRARADLVAKGMNASGWSLIDVSVGTSNAGPHLVRHERARMQSFADAAPPPAFEAGTSEVRVQASGIVELD